MSKITDTPEYNHKRKLIQAEINRNCIKPLSFEIYKKTALEKEELKVEKAKHKEYLRQLKGLI